MEVLLSGRCGHHTISYNAVISACENGITHLLRAGVNGACMFGLLAFVLPPMLLDVDGMCNGILVMLVAITAGFAVMKLWESVIIGAIGGL
eukprot:3094381-Prorocentrum_lima.AAC.1